MAGPPEQKEAPRSVSAPRGAKNEPGGSDDKQDGRESMFPAWVKRAARAAWPSWLGAQWLKNRRRAAP